ncbi:M16 family metallopeptidase [Yunchengibacter salinarum]|uniref:M16 family metallopeptidase n=1 Tax=Yunchengibacter salinarum TaxID=3133399 RepID=UPI0035B623AE
MTTGGLLLATGGAGAFAAGDEGELKIAYDTFTLENGLRVVVHEDRKAPVVAVGVWYHVGSKNEPEGKTGFAHLFEHLMFNGSENFDGEFFEPLEKVGATDLNGTTWFDRTNYFETVPKPALDLALWLESDRMGHLLGAVTQEKLENQIGVVQNEKRQGDNEPYGLVTYRQLEGLFPAGHPYRHSTIGSMEDLSAASLDDVKNWFREYYGTANTVVVLAGDITVDEARDKVSHYFGDIEPGPPVQRLKQWVPVKDQSVFETMQDRVPQSRIYRSWAVAPRTDRDALRLDVAAEVLTNGKTGPLYKALVYDAEIATGVRASLQRQELASIFEVRVDVKPGADPKKAEALLDQVMAEFLEKGPTSAQVKRARTTMRADVLRGLEKMGGFGGVGAVLARGTLYAGDAGFINTELDWLENARRQGVSKAARSWLSRGFHQITVTPFGDLKTAGGGADRSQPPAVGEMPDLTFPPLETATLDNGMKVVLARRKSVPVVRFGFQMDAGYAADQGRKPGTASFTLGMMGEGTTSRSALELSDAIRDLGARIDTDSTLDTSHVGLTALAENLPESVGLAADVIRNPAFDPTELERLRKRWIARINREKAQPVQLGLRTLPPLLYGDGHAYANPLTGTGTVASIQAIAREDLVAFHRDWVRPDNMTVFVVGDVAMGTVMESLNRAFGDWRAPESPVPTKNLAPVDLPDGDRVVILDRPGSPQSLILGGLLLPPTGAADELPLNIANSVLGGNFTARVNMNLREDKGWAYGAYTITFDARGQRMWLAYAPVQSDKTGESLTELLSEVNSYLGDAPATKAELSKVVRNRVNSLPGRFESNGAVLDNLMSNSRFGRPLDHVTTLKDRLSRMDPDKLMTAARAHLHPDRITWLIVGDADTIRSELEGLDLGPVEEMSSTGP